VRAKRWLVAQDPTYEISPVSRASLMLQGGPATPRQVQRWARHPWWGDALRLRRWDDAAKVAGLAVPGLAEYAPLLV
jgi:predicted HD phosphohydrolase